MTATASKGNKNQNGENVFLDEPRSFKARFPEVQDTAVYFLATAPC